MNRKNVSRVALKTLGLGLALGTLGMSANAQAACTRAGYFQDDMYSSPDVDFTFTGVWTHSTSFPQAINGSISWSNDIATVGGAVMGWLEPSKSVSFQLECRTAFDYHYTRAYNRGRASITAYNHATNQWHNLANVDLYSSTVVFGATTRVTLPSADRYTIHIFTWGEKNPAATDNYIDIDGITPR